MEASVQRQFSGNRCINCMCHSTENLYQYKTTSLIRAADDFYPRDDASQPAHLANGAVLPLTPSAPLSCPDLSHLLNPSLAVAYNSLFLGEFGHVDWDMFQSTHPDAEMHAAARAVGGSPVYVSDKPGQVTFLMFRSYNSRDVLAPDAHGLTCALALTPAAQL